MPIRRASSGGSGVHSAFSRIGDVVAATAVSNIVQCSHPMYLHRSRAATTVRGGVAGSPTQHWLFYVHVVRGRCLACVLDRVFYGRAGTLLFILGLDRSGCPACELVQERHIVAGTCDRGTDARLPTHRSRWLRRDTGCVGVYSNQGPTDRIQTQTCNPRLWA